MVVVRTLLLPLAFAWVFFVTAIAMLLALLAPAFVSRHQQYWVRSLGVVSCWLLGVKISVEGIEQLDAEGGRIIAFNHINILDLVVLASLWRNGWSAVYKQEFNSIPLIGRTMRFLGLIPIDRRNREAAVRTLASAAELVRCEQKSLLIAPEGTRSSSGQLGPFKSGAFHLACDLQVPIVPLLMIGNQRVMRGLLVYGGKVTVRLLPAIDTAGWSGEQLPEQIAATRNVFLAGLGQ